MAAGTVSGDLALSVTTSYGSYPFPITYAQSVDEVYPPFTFEVADGATDTSLLTAAAAALTTVQVLQIVSTVAVTLKLGAAGSNVAFALAAKAPLTLMGTSLTALSISNASGSTAMVTLMIAGT